MQALDSGSPDALDGSLDALYKVCALPVLHLPTAHSASLQVCDEIPSNLDLDVVGLPARPAALLIPRLLSLFSRCACFGEA